MPAEVLQSIVKSLWEKNEAPVFIAIDGRSGSGKTTIASQLQKSLGQHRVSVIEGDSFYTGGSAAQWDNRSASENAAATINRATLSGVLQSLRTTGTATWEAFDWHSKVWDSATPPLESGCRAAQVKPLVIVEGVYSGSQELARHFHCRVLLKVPAAICDERIKQRDQESYCPDWSIRWREAENYYFTHSASADQFDLVLRAT